MRYRIFAIPAILAIIVNLFGGTTVLAASAHETSNEGSVSAIIEQMNNLSATEAHAVWSAYLRTKPNISFSYLSEKGILYTAEKFHGLSVNEVNQSEGMPKLANKQNVANFLFLENTTTEASSNSIFFYNHNNLINESIHDSFSFAPDQEDHTVVIIGSGETYFVWQEIAKATETMLEDGEHNSSGALLEQFNLTENERPNAVGQTCPSGHLAQQALSKLGWRDNANDPRHAEQYQLMGQLTVKQIKTLGLDISIEDTESTNMVTSEVNNAKITVIDLNTWELVVIELVVLREEDQAAIAPMETSTESESTTINQFRGEIETIRRLLDNQMDRGPTTTTIDQSRASPHTMY